MPGEDDDKPAATPGAASRPIGKETGLVKREQIEAEKTEKLAAIAADVRKAEIAADLERAKIAAGDHDGDRDDRRATIRTVLLWSTGFVGTVGALVLLGFAVYYRADFHFAGFGIDAGTTTTTTTSGGTTTTRKDTDAPQKEAP